jgi:hypothetical protein
MPDFNAQGPQEPNTLNDRLRTVLMANWVRIVLISLGLFFFVMVVVPGGLLIYQYSGIGDQQPADQQPDRPETVTCDEIYLSQAGECIPPDSPEDSIVCRGKSRDLVVPASSTEGPCLDAGELHRADCGGGGVWVDETSECIPTARTIQCAASSAGNTGECHTPEEGMETVDCYAYYIYRREECISP